MPPSLISIRFRSPEFPSAAIRVTATSFFPKTRTLGLRSSRFATQPTCPTNFFPDADATRPAPARPRRAGKNSLPARPRLVEKRNERHLSARHEHPQLHRQGEIPPHVHVCNRFGRRGACISSITGRKCVPVLPGGSGAPRCMPQWKPCCSSSSYCLGEATRPPLWKAESETRSRSERFYRSWIFKIAAHAIAIGAVPLPMITLFDG